MRTTLDQQKHIVLVNEADPAKGGQTVAQARAECPVDIRSSIFEGRDAITWLRIADFQLLSLKLICHEILCAVPLYSGLESTGRHLGPGGSNAPLCRSTTGTSVLQRGLYVPGELLLRNLSCEYHEPVSLFCSPNNPGAVAVGEELAAQVGGIVPQETWSGDLIIGVPISRRPLRPAAAAAAAATAAAAAAAAAAGQSKSKFSIRRPRHIKSRVPSKPGQEVYQNADGNGATHMLLYLDCHTWLDAAGDALAKEVAAARARKLPIIMVHEQDESRGACEFAQLFETTPQALIDDGLYAHIAIALYAPPHRAVGFAMAGLALGAKDQPDMSDLARVGSTMMSDAAAAAAAAVSKADEQSQTAAASIEMQISEHLERGVNFIENAINVDIDRDGDVGLMGRPTVSKVGATLENHAGAEEADAGKSERKRVLFENSEPQAVAAEALPAPSVPSSEPERHRRSQQQPLMSTSASSEGVRLDGRPAEERSIFRVTASCNAPPPPGAIGAGAGADADADADATLPLAVEYFRARQGGVAAVVANAAGVPSSEPEKHWRSQQQPLMSTSASSKGVRLDGRPADERGSAEAVMRQAHAAVVAEISPRRRRSGASSEIRTTRRLPLDVEATNTCADPTPAQQETQSRRRRTQSPEQAREGQYAETRV